MDLVDDATGMTLAKQLSPNMAQGNFTRPSAAQGDLSTQEQFRCREVALRSNWAGIKWDYEAQNS